ncbi:immune inhibitor A domain-containing protein [Streptomyces fructofermentans]|uniref:immune inhibitor A domain-containing protein n=1 Tax=Streptomyces fructofermentans TaxID=152141 RepID=UPI0037A7D93F
MSKRIRRTQAAVVAVLAALAVLPPGNSTAASAVRASTAPSAARAPGHDLLSAAGRRSSRARALAVAQVAAGRAVPETRGSSQRIEYRAGRYAETRRTTDRVFVLPVEFPDQRHNDIPRPDRSTDNTTVWTRDYSRDYYRRQIFGRWRGSLKSYYRRQSSGAYSITGTVHAWTRVGHRLAYYGTDSCTRDGAAVSTYYCNRRLVTDGLDQWYEDRRADGWSARRLAEYLSTYDRWDRNDFDGDGVFNEPDGYLDRVMMMFAGESQANGGGARGTDTLGSHRGTVSHLQSGAGRLGPANGNHDGGSPVGGSGIWVNDYTMTNENRGLGTLAHEYGHDLGLPDLYDTSGGENSTGFWSAMSQGSLLSDEHELARHPGDLGAWAKLQLGWLDHEAVEAGTAATVTLNPLSVNSATPGSEALVVRLPADADGNSRSYVVENRQYTGDDVHLKSGPFHLGWAGSKPRLKERLGYGTGVLIWYWNTRYRDNRTRANGGHGLILPVDAHAEPFRGPSGAVLRNRLQAYDAPFGRRPTAPLVLHVGGVRTTVPSRPGVPVFDDRGRTHHHAAAPYGSSRDADSGTTITVDREYPDGRVKVSVGSSG